MIIYLSTPLPRSTHKWMGHFAMILSEDMLVRSQTRINGTPPLREWWIQCIEISRHAQNVSNSTKIRQSAKNRQFWASVENWHTQTYEIVMLVLKSRGYTLLRMGQIISQVWMDEYLLSSKLRHSRCKMTEIWSKSDKNAKMCQMWRALNILLIKLMMLVSPFQDRHNHWIRLAKLVENLS